MSVPVQQMPEVSWQCCIFFNVLHLVLQNWGVIHLGLHYIYQTGKKLNVGANTLSTWRFIFPQSHYSLFSIFQESKEAQSTDEKILVRGRVYNGNKPQTFNQSWTDEEQRKYVQLHHIP